MKKKRKSPVDKSREARRGMEAHLAIHGWYPINNGMANKEIGMYGRNLMGKFMFERDQYLVQQYKETAWGLMSSRLFWLCVEHIQKKHYEYMDFRTPSPTGRMSSHTLDAIRYQAMASSVWPMNTSKVHI